MLLIIWPPFSLDFEKQSKSSHFNEYVFRTEGDHRIPLDGDLLRYCNLLIRYFENSRLDQHQILFIKTAKIKKFENVFFFFLLFLSFHLNFCVFETKLRLSKIEAWIFCKNKNFTLFDFVFYSMHASRPFPTIVNTSIFSRVLSRVLAMTRICIISIFKIGKYKQ